ncbi:unnamed protein product [Paramecium pentaurelia]|uniref:Uncharacterized protein n=1 Tax=Paramecium pentaurelia TaxID=43138 RepID=A0A8S1Y4P7_9CILI|nr:unnamed protein product [Paramecium pentaurelia]
MIAYDEAYIKSLQKKARNYSFVCNLNIFLIIIWIIQVLQNNMITFNPQLQFNTFDYQLLEQNSIKEPEWCFSFAFNKDSTILAVGCQSYIKLFEFTNERVSLNQILMNTDFVRSIYFMKKSQNLISGGEDSSILVWQKNQDHQWFIYQKLLGHSKPIKHIIMNQNEDLIISCSSDKTIKFWVSLV